MSSWDKERGKEGVSSWDKERGKEGVSSCDLKKEKTPGSGVSITLGWTALCNWEVMLIHVHYSKC